jgi:hypothetical protein
MADRDYNITFTAPSDAAIASLDALIQRLTTLDRLCDQVKPKLAGISAGVSRGIGGVSQSCNTLNTSLGNVATKAATAQAGLAGLATQTAGTGQHVQALSGHANHATGAFGAWADKGLHLNGTLMRVGYAAAGITSAVSLWTAFADSMHNAEEYASKCADKVLKLNEAVRETQAITGKTKEETKSEILDLMSKTGLKEEEANKFTKMWGSTIPAAKQSGGWKLSDKDTEAVKVEAGHFAATQGIDPAVMGRMVASIGIGQDVRTADDVLAQLGGMHAMAVEGVGTFTPLMKVYNKLRGKMIDPKGKGAAKDPAELMALISATSVETGNEAQISTAMSQVWRDLSVAKTKGQKASFAKYGLDKGGDFATRIEKIAPLVEGAAEEGKDPAQALSDAGFKNATANTMIVNLVRDRAIMRSRVTASRKALDPNKIRETNRQADLDDPQRLAAAAVDVTRLEKGKDEQLLKPYRQFVEAGLEKNAGYVGGDSWFGGTNYREKLQYTLNLSVGREAPRDATQDAVIRRLIKRDQPAVAKRMEAQYRKQKGLFSANEAEGEDLGKQINALSPKEQEKLNASLRGYAKEQSPADQAKMRGTWLSQGEVWDKLVPAQRTPAASKPLMATPPPKPGAAPAGGPTASAGPAADGGLASLNAEQLRVLRSIDRKLDGGGPGDLDTDGGDSGPLRIG